MTVNVRSAHVAHYVVTHYCVLCSILNVDRCVHLAAHMCGDVHVPLCGLYKEFS